MPLDTTKNPDTAIQIIDEVSPAISRSNWQGMAQVGTCIHNIFAIYQPGNNPNETNATASSSTTRPSRAPTAC